MIAEKENLILTNYFLTPGGDNHDGRGYDRYEKIETTLKAKGGEISEEDAMKLLVEKSWTGNIRELRNVVERLLILWICLSPW